MKYNLLKVFFFFSIGSFCIVSSFSQGIMRELVLVEEDSPSDMPQIKIRRPRASVIPLAFSSDAEFMLSIMDWNEICLVNVQKKLELRSLVRYTNISEKEATAVFSQDNAFVKITVKEKSFVFNTTTGAQDKSKNAIEWNKSAFLENKEKVDLDFHFYAPSSGDYLANDYSPSLGFVYEYVYSEPSDCSPSSIVVANQTSLVRYSMLGNILNVYLKNSSERICGIAQKENKLVAFFEKKVIVYDLESGNPLKQYELENKELSYGKYEIDLEKEYFIFCNNNGWSFKYDLKTNEITNFFGEEDEILTKYRCYCENRYPKFLLKNDKLVFFTEENQILLFNVVTSEIQIIPLDFNLDALRRKNNLDYDTLNYYFETCENSDQVLLGLYDEHGVTYLSLLLNLADGKYTVIKKENGEIWGNITRIGYVSENLSFIEAEKRIYQYNVAEKKITHSYKSEQNWGYNIKTKTLILLNKGSATIYNRNGKILKKITDWNTFRKSEYYMPFANISWRGFEEWNPLLCENGVPQEFVYGFLFLGTDYLTYTPEGFFTGTEWACKNLVYIVDGLEVTELTQLYDKLYRPDLIAAKAHGEDISEYAKEINFASLVRTGKPPLVTLRDLPDSVAEETIKPELLIKDEGGGIGNVYLKLNGTAVRIASGGDSIKGQTSSVESYSISLESGENILEAYAYNSAGTIESLHAVKKITCARKNKEKESDFYVLSVGIDKYQEKRFQLACSVADAQGINGVFEHNKAKAYRNLYTDSLLDGAVTKNGFAKKIEKCAEKVSENDVFILYLSGHGTTCKNGDYYYIPVDISSNKDSEIMEKGISKKDIAQSLFKIKAKQKILIIDTCHAGAIVSEESEQTAFERMNSDVGYTIFMASFESEPALEDFNGHGVFTYTVMEALSGKADKDSNRAVDMTELIKYIDAVLPERSRKTYLHEQKARVKIGGNSDTVLLPLTESK